MNTSIFKKEKKRIRKKELGFTPYLWQHCQEDGGRSCGEYYH